MCRSLNGKIKLVGIPIMNGGKLIIELPQLDEEDFPKGNSTVAV